LFIYLKFTIVVFFLHYKLTLMHICYVFMLFIAHISHSYHFILHWCDWHLFIKGTLTWLNVTRIVLQTLMKFGYVRHADCITM